MKLSERKIRNICEGRELYCVRNILSSDFGFSDENIHVKYVESEEPRNIVKDITFFKEGSRVLLTVTSKNPIRFLPSIYSDNDFLRRFLMIFQHVANETNLVLDNSQKMFQPLQVRKEFLQELCSWFDVDFLHGADEKTVRVVLQNIIDVYRFKCTPKGIELVYRLVTGMTPVIRDGFSAFSSFNFCNETGVEETILRQRNSSRCFTVCFSVHSDFFTKEELHRMKKILRWETPAGIESYLCFKSKASRKRKVTVLSSSDSSTVDEICF